MPSWPARFGAPINTSTRNICSSSSSIAVAGPPQQSFIEDLVLFRNPLFAVGVSLRLGICRAWNYLRINVCPAENYLVACPHHTRSYCNSLAFSPFRRRSAATRAALVMRRWIHHHRRVGLLRPAWCPSVPTALGLRPWGRMYFDEALRSIHRPPWTPTRLAFDQRSTSSSLWALHFITYLLMKKRGLRPRSGLIVIKKPSLDRPANTPTVIPR